MVYVVVCVFRFVGHFSFGFLIFFFFKQKTAYEMRISDWSSDVCSSDLWQWQFHQQEALPPMTATVTATATAIYPSLKDRVVFVTGGGGGIGDRKRVV